MHHMMTRHDRKNVTFRPNDQVISGLKLEQLKGYDILGIKHEKKQARFYNIIFWFFNWFSVSYIGASDFIRYSDTVALTKIKEWQFRWVLKAPIQVHTFIKVGLSRYFVVHDWQKKLTVTWKRRSVHNFKHSKFC